MVSLRTVRLEQLDLAVEVEGAVFEHVGELAVEGLLHDVQRGLGAGQRAPAISGDDEPRLVRWT